MCTSYNDVFVRNILIKIDSSWFFFASTSMNFEITFVEMYKYHSV